MDIKDYLNPVEYSNESFKKGFLGNSTVFNINSKTQEELKNFDLAIVGVPEDRNSGQNTGSANGPTQFRKYFYHHTIGFSSYNVIDIGDVRIGATPQDTYKGLSYVLTELLKLEIVPIIIGGSQDLTYANFLAYEQLEQIINIVSIDNSFDLGDVDEPMHAQGFLSKIILHQPSYLFNFSNLGYQTYFVTQEEIGLMDKLHFDAYRLGNVRADLTEAEPIIRNADLVSFDISAIRQSDAPANKNVTPNGFYGEEACQLARYAGLSDKCSSIGFYELNPEVEDRGQTAYLLSQMVWYFIEGFYARKGEIPEMDKKDYLKYIVNSADREALIFFKNLKSDRWWMDIPHPRNNVLKFKRHQMVPCSYKDYLLACKDEMPERWLQTFQKLM